jgi:hypothetical protein
MHVTFAMFADAANLSQEGKLNILGVFDALQVATLPTVHPRASLVVRLKGARIESGQHTVSLQWLNPSGVELWSSVGQLEVAAPPPNVNEMDMPLIANVDLPLDEPGAYTMRIALDSHPSADLKLQVRAPAPMPPASGMLS